MFANKLSKANSFLIRRHLRPRQPCTSRSALSTTSPLSPYVDGNETHFGFSQVPIESKQAKVKEVFMKVADNYDLMNDAMSGGLHRMWKDYLVQVSCIPSIAPLVRQQQSSSFRILDVAGGTGDIAFRFLDAAGCADRAASSGQDPIQVTVCDINPEMLRVGRQRAEQRYSGRNLQDDGGSQALVFQEGNAQDLVGVADNSFDMYTIAFGLRNVTDVDMALREALRVLKPGGRFFCLEFSKQLDSSLLQQVYDAYSFHVIPAMGQALAGDKESYQYLVESIRRFPNQQELQQRMEDAGFHHCKYTNLTGGIVALHEGFKAI